ncbi:MAG: carnitine-CoA ligase [Subtercola sp.]|nr:carnitine-CoA ligase [Subtercola sp.]
MVLQDDALRVQEADQTVADLVRRRARDDPQRVLVTFDEGALTYGELDERADRICWLLRANGIGPGDRVGAMLENGPHAIVMWVALARLGATEVPLNPAFRGESLAYPLTKTGCRVLVTSAAHVDEVVAVRDSVDTLTHVFVAEVVAGVPLPAGFTDLDAALSDLSRAEYPSETTSGDVSIVLFSSGTTGPPKGVELSHSANLALASGVVAAMHYTADDVLYNAFPFSHVNARFTTVYAAMLAGARVVLHRRFSASRFWSICAEQGVTAFNYMGVIPVLLLEQAPSDADREHQVAKGYGSGAPGEIADTFESRFGVALVETYGSTELGMASHTRLGERRPGSCGVATAHYEIQIQDGEGRQVGEGSAGEIVVRPRRPGAMFRGYFDDPAATVSAWRELWFHTGDRGYLDKDGWLYFVDRMKDVIRRRGENISSWEVERALESHPSVAEACAVGVASEISGEELLVVLVMREPEAPESLLRHTERHLPYFAVPRYVRFVNQLPRTASARVEKYKLRAAGITADTWDRDLHGFELRR